MKQTIRDYIRNAKEIIKAPVKFVKPRGLVYNGSPPGIRNRFTPAEYSLNDIAKAYDSITGDRPIIFRLDGRIIVDSIENVFESMDGYRYTENEREYLEPFGNLETLSHDESQRLDWENLPDWFIAEHLTQREREDYNKYSLGNCSDGKNWNSIVRVRNKTRKWNHLRVGGIWARVPYLTRHKVSKRIFKVRSKFGETSVTEDHSLISYADGFFQRCSPLDDRYTPVAVFGIPPVDTDAEIDLADFISDSPLVTITDTDIIWANVAPNSNYKSFSFQRKLPVEHLKAAAFARVLGAYLSEGGVNCAFRQFRIANTDSSWLTSLAEDFALVFSKRPTISKDSQGVFHLDVSGKLISDILINAGGRLSEGKRIHNNIFHWPDNLKREMMNTMCQGDAHLDSLGQWHYTTKSKLLAAGFHLLCKMQGIGTMWSYKTAWEGQNYYTIHQQQKFNNARSDFGKIQIIDVTQDHTGFVYDLEVEDTHTFVDATGNVLLHNTEALFARAADKYAEQIMKNEFNMMSKNPNAANYIRQRFNQIARVSNITTHQLFSSIAENIAIYSNAFLLKVRNEDSSGGRVWYDLEGEKRIPVAAYYPLDPTSLSVSIDQNGKILGWRQTIPGVPSVDYVPEDVIHFAYNRKTGLVFGTPIVWPVLDDIRALRRIEENVELLVFQHAVPLFHFKIGTEDAAGDYEEVLEAQALWNTMPSEGMIITTERYDIKSVGVDGSVIDIEPYLEYYRQRIFMGLGVSDVSMGQGSTSNRSTSTNMIKEMQNRTQKIQRLIKDTFDHAVINELLREGGFNWDEYDPFNKVELYITEVDFDERMKKENHFIDQYTKNAITEDEMRKAIGRDPISERKKLFFWTNQVPLALIGSRDEISGLGPNGGNPTGSVSKTTELGLKVASPDGPEDNKARPENQFGKKTAATRAANKDFADALLSENLSGQKLIDHADDGEVRCHQPSYMDQIDHDVFLEKLNVNYQALRRDISVLIKGGISGKYTKKLMGSRAGTLIDSYKSLMEDISESFLLHAYSVGYRSSAPSNSQYLENIADRRIVVETGEKFLRFFINDLKYEAVRIINKPSISDTNDLLLEIRALFNSQEYRVEKFSRYWAVRSYNVGVARGLSLSGYDTAVVRCHTDCQTCQSLEIQLGDKLDYNLLPAYHPNCLCMIQPKENEK